MNKEWSATPIKSIFIMVPMMAILLIATPATTVFAQSEEQQQQQTCPDGSQPDENGICPSEQQEQPSIHDQICNAYHNDAVQALALLLPLAHIISGGTTTAIMAAAALYCGFSASPATNDNQGNGTDNTGNGG